MKNISPYAKDALNVLKQGGVLRSQKQRDGSILIFLYDQTGERLGGTYNAVQIVLDGMGVLNGTIVPEDDHHVCEWIYWPQEEPWDYDPRSMANTVYA